MAILLVDLDETLVDRAAVLRVWAAEVADRHPGDPDLVDWLVAWDRDHDEVRDRTDFLSGLAERLGCDTPVAQLLARWPGEFGARYRLDASTRAALILACASGIPVVVVTNGAAASQRAKLEAMDLTDIVSGWVISGEIGVHKPDPAIFAAAAEVAGAPLSGSWMIGDDARRDVEAARTIGLHPIWVNRHGAAWPTGLQPAEAVYNHPAPAIRHGVRALSASRG